MAKTGFWLRNAKGKLAGATIYSQNGETVMREVVTPANPKTERQILQRVIMHTVMQSYSKMKEICDHSFEGMKKGQDTMSYFMKRNVQIARQKVAELQESGSSLINAYNFMPLGYKGFTPNQYQIAMGSLPKVECSLRDDYESAGFVPVITTNTYEAVINALGLQRGDQLTFIMIDGNAAADYGQANFHFCRVILDPTNADNTQAALSVPFVDADGKINLPSVRNEGNFTFNVNATRGLGFEYNGSLTCVACAVIVSRQVGDNWLRSTTYLAYSGREEYSLGECIEMAQSSGSTIYAPSEQYLNNAGEGGGAAASGTSGTDSGQSSSTPSLASATIGGNAMINGTTKTLSGEDATSGATLVANGNNVTGLFLSVRNGSTEVASAGFNNGVATISTGTWNDGVLYRLWIVDEDGENAVNTNYSFQYNQNTGGFNMGGD